jgi:hypothetical protein
LRKRIPKRKNLTKIRMSDMNCDWSKVHWDHNYGFSNASSLGFAVNDWPHEISFKVGDSERVYLIELNDKSEFSRIYNCKTDSSKILIGAHIF